MLTFSHLPTKKNISQSVGWLLCTLPYQPHVSSCCLGQGSAYFWPVDSMMKSILAEIPVNPIIRLLNSLFVIFVIIQWHAFHVSTQSLQNTMIFLISNRLAHANAINDSKTTINHKTIFTQTVTWLSFSLHSVIETARRPSVPCLLSVAEDTRIHHYAT